MKYSRLFAASVLFLGVGVEAAFAQSEYQVITVTDPATITGTVKWSGPVPKLPVLNITKNPDICDPHGHKKRDLERLVIGPNGGVANTVVFLRNVTTGKAMDLPPQRRFLNQHTCRYEPHLLLVPQNGEAQMKSSDPILHTIHMTGAAEYNLPFPFIDQVISRSLKHAGTVDLRCNAGHVWMNAEMLVVTHPYYAITDENGRFELKGVPPGDYEIVAWHEGWEIVWQEELYDVLTQQKVQRPVFSSPMTWDKKVSVGPNATVPVNFVISAKSVDVAQSR